MRLKGFEIHVYSDGARAFYGDLGIIVIDEHDVMPPERRQASVIFRQVKSIPAPSVLPSLTIEVSDLREIISSLTGQGTPPAERTSVQDPDGRRVILLQG